MDELVQFLRARLNEDEQTARRAGGAWTDGPAANWVTAASSGDASEPAHRVALVVADGERAHIVRHDPARALREVEAKRQLMRWHETCTLRDPVRNVTVPRTGPCEHLRLLASVYADHPDYRAEWRP